MTSSVPLNLRSCHPSCGRSSRRTRYATAACNQPPCKCVGQMMIAALVQIMKEKLRKYKGRTSTLEQQVSQKNNQIVVLEDTINTLKQQLAVSAEGLTAPCGAKGYSKSLSRASASPAKLDHVNSTKWLPPACTLQSCARTPADVQQEQQLKDTLYQKERKIAVGCHGLFVEGLQGSAAGHSFIMQASRYVQPLLQPVTRLEEHRERRACALALASHVLTLACIAMQNMEHEVLVLRQKLETDSRLQRQNLAGAKREQESLKKQIVQAQVGTGTGWAGTGGWIQGRASKPVAFVGSMKYSLQSVLLLPLLHPPPCLGCTWFTSSPQPCHCACWVPPVRRPLNPGLHMPDSRWFTYLRTSPPALAQTHLHQLNEPLSHLSIFA
jgi:hypothetical protein